MGFHLHFNPSLLFLVSFLLQQTQTRFNTFYLFVYFNPFTPTDNLSHPNTMDRRVHSVLKGLRRMLMLINRTRSM